MLFLSKLPGIGLIINGSKLVENRATVDVKFLLIPE